MISRSKIFLALIIIAIGFSSCEEEFAPKPRGFFRIDLPEKEYVEFNQDYPYSFEYPKYAQIIYKDKDSAWINIVFPANKATIYLTYKKVRGNLDMLLDESQKIVNKHIVKADAISEQVFVDDSVNTYGILYSIKGNTASSVNFFLTDSTDNFIRGSLYFNVAPNKDSLAPVINFIKDDIAHLIETFKWEKENAFNR